MCRPSHPATDSSEANCSETLEEKRVAAQEEEKRIADREEKRFMGEICYGCGVCRRCGTHTPSGNYVRECTCCSPRECLVHVEWWQTRTSARERAKNRVGVCDACRRRGDEALYDASETITQHVPLFSAWR